MPNVNLTDSRSRDAVVKAETTGVDEEVRYVDDEKQAAYTRKILKATVEHDFDTLVKSHAGDAEALGKALIESDPEVDMEICGLYLWGVSKVYVDSSDGIVYRIEQQEIVRGPDGAIRETRPRNRPEANVDSEIPLTWTGRKIDKNEAVRRFVFASKLQIVHINGLTYDFLYGMAKELSESNSLMMVGGGSKGRDPLVFRRGSVPYRGFLEGRIDGDKYLLLLHLSNLELKVPSGSRVSDTEEASDKDSVKKKAASKTVVKDQKKPVVGKTKTKKSEAEPPEERPEKRPEEQKKERKKEREEDLEEVTAKKAGSEKSTQDQKESARPSAASKSDNDAENNTAIGNSRKSKKDDQSNAKDAKAKKAKPAIVKTKESDAGSAASITSEDLGIWLRSIRMGKYLKLFVENEIDVDVLAELTDDDLKELDIPLGSRRRLLKAVEETDNLHAEVASAVKQMTGKPAKQTK